MERFIETFSDRYGIPRADGGALLRAMEAVRFGKGEHIVRQGEYNDVFHILRTGICRAYTSAEDGEVSLWFAFGGEAMFDVFSYHGGEPSPVGIEAETDCEAFRLPKERLESLCAVSVGMANAVRRIFERHAYVFEGNILALAQSKGGMERYLSLLRRHPELLRHVPLKKLASYLFVTPQSLSRIRAELAATLSSTS